MNKHTYKHINVSKDDESSLVTIGCSIHFVLIFCIYEPEVFKLDILKYNQFFYCRNIYDFAPLPQLALKILLSRTFQKGLS